MPKYFYNGFLLMWCNFKFEGVLFRSDSRYNYVDCNDCPVCSLFIKFDISSCDLCKTVLGGLGLWVIYNSFYKGVESIEATEAR